MKKLYVYADFDWLNTSTPYKRKKGVPSVMTRLYYISF